MHDKKIHTVAALFIDDTLQASPYGSRVSPAERDALINAAAEAMQQAIEAECQDVEQELHHRFRDAKEFQ